MKVILLFCLSLSHRADPTAGLELAPPAGSAGRSWQWWHRKQGELLPPPLSVCLSVRQSVLVPDVPRQPPSASTVCPPPCRGHSARPAGLGWPWGSGSSDQCRVRRHSRVWAVRRAAAPLAPPCVQLLSLALPGTPIVPMPPGQALLGVFSIFILSLDAEFYFVKTIVFVSPGYCPSTF